MRLARTTRAAGLALCLLRLLPAQKERDTEKFTVAMGLIQRELHDEAATTLRAFLKEQPRHALATEAWYRLGTCCLALKQPDEATLAFTTALKKSDGFKLRAECRYRLGHTLKEQHKLEPAAAQFAQLRQEEARDHYLLAAAAFAEGECRRDLKQEEPALAAFQAAVAADQDPAGAYAVPAGYQLGFLLLQREKFPEAHRAFADAVKRNPKHEAATECQFLAGQAALQGKDFAAAEAAFRAAGERGGEYADDAAMGLAWCRLESGDRAASLAQFRVVVRQFGDSPLVPRARLEAARLLFKDGKQADVLRELEPLLTQSDLAKEIQLPALELAGFAALDQKQAKTAQQLFARALAAGPEATAVPRLHHGSAEALAELGQWDEAAAAYRKAAAANPDPQLAGDILYGDTLALHRLGRFEESLARAQELLQKHGSHRLAPHARFAVAENLFALKRHAEAEAAYAQVPAGEFAGKAAFKGAWCAYLQGHHGVAVQRFLQLAEDAKAEPAHREEALAMAALGALQDGKDDQALELADRYRARHQRGGFLARTERVAARVLKRKNELTAAADRLRVAAAAETSAEQGAEDRVEQGELLFQKGDFAGARALYRELADRSDALGARAQAGLAWCAFELGEDEACQTSLQKVMTHPQGKDQQPAMLELLTSLHHRAQRWGDAEATATRFLAAYGNHARVREVRYALAVAQARGGKPEPARATLQALSEDPPPGRADRVFYELAWACEKSGDHPAALAAFKRVAELTKDEDLLGEARLHLGTALLEQKQAEPGRELLAQVRGTQRARALYRLGFAWLDAQQPRQAFTAFEEIATGPKDQPLHLEAVCLAGESQYLAEDWASCATHLRAFLKDAPEHERAQTARLHLGRCEVQGDKPERAAAALEEFIRRAKDPADEAARRDLAFASLWLGKARMARKEYERAEQALARVTELSEGDWAAEAQYLLGQARLQRGDKHAAVDAFVKLSILYAQPEWVARGLLAAGRCYEELEQPQKAKKFYEELVKRFETSPSSTEARQRLKLL